MKLLIFACLVAVACAYPSRLGEEKCTYGPSYWCENYKQADKCQAIEHCRKYVWKAKGADQCDDCKAAITQLHTFVTTNSTKVIEILKNICAGLKTESTMCKFYVETYGSGVVAALTEITSDSEKLCQELELCTGGKIQIMREIFVKKLKTHPYIIALKSVKADYCEDCKLVFSEIKDLLEDKDMQKEIIAALEALCTEFGSFADQCKSYIDQYLPLILDELATLDDPTEICNELGLCNSTQKAAGILQPPSKKLLIPIMPGPVIFTPPEKKEKSADADQCDECKAAVTQLHTLLTTNSTKVLEILNNVCAGLKKGPAECKVAVSLYGKQVIAALTEITSDSAKLCQELELCTGGKIQIMREIFVKKLKTHSYIVALKSVKADYCEDCKLVFSEIKDLLEDKDMQKEIIAALEALCTEFGSFADQCKSYIDQYLPLILDELATLDDPTEICNELGLCNSTQKAAGILQPQSKKLLIPIMPGPVIFTPPEKKEKSADADQCDECKAAVTQLHTLLTTNSTKVLEILNNVCAGLKTGSAECKFAVATYGNQVIAALTEITSDSAKLCQELEMCTGGKIKIMREIFVKKLKTHPYIVALKSVKADYCEDCKLAFGEIKDLLEDKDMQKEIIAALEALCTEFGSFADQCKSYIDQYLPLILDELASLDDPTEICNELGLCNSTQKAAGIVKALNILQPQSKNLLIPMMMPGPVLTPPEKKEKSTDADQCTECKAAVTQLHTLLTTNSTKVIEILNNVCAGLKTGAAECKFAVATYGSQIIAALTEITSDSAKLCQELEMCTGGKVQIMREIFVKKLKTHPYIVALKSVKADYCEDCKLVFSEIKDLLEDKDMQKEIIAALEALCTEFGSFADQCKSYIDQYLPLILDELATLDDPTEICNELGLCNSTQKAAGIVKALNILQPQSKNLLIPMMMPGPVILTPEKKEKSTDDKCDECKAAVKQVHYYLVNNSTKILAIMKKLCPTLVPAAECNLILGLYGEMIIETLKNATANGEKLCQELEMCPSTHKEEIIKTLLLKNLKMHPKIIALKSVKADYCNDCKLVFAEIKDLLEDKSMQQEIISLVETLCTELGSFADQCKTYVDAYLPLILEELATLDDPTTLCTELGLCNSTKNGVDVLEAVRLVPAKTKSAKVEADPKCDFCVFVMKKVDSMLGDNATKEEIEAVLEKVCMIFPSPTELKCLTFMDKYRVVIVKLLLQGLQPEKICTELGLCPSKPVKPKVEAGPECILCEFAMRELDSILGDNATKEEIEAALEKVCSLLPSTIKSECDTFVEEYGPEILKLLLQELQPDQICAELGLCSSKPVKPKTKSVKVEAGPECILCEFAMRELDSILGDNATKEEIEAALEKVCSLLPSTIRSECDMLVNKYGPEIVQLLLQGLQPEKICAELGLCSSKSVKPKTKSVKVEAGPECILCEFAMRELDSILGDNATKEEIEAALEKVCSLLPSTIRSECDTFVEEYGPEILKLLLQELQPDQICAELGLCSSKSVKLSFKKPTIDTCDVCKNSVEFVENLVEQSLELLIKIILGVISPDEVCKLLRLCPGSQKLQIKDECSLGESYWCASYKNALKCDALVHCNYLA
ncbi:hypothetical protein BSL78_18317 [Paramuricea clavata]|uniref:Uncharacterized protein n=1 Tax=Paramuricea clavata TaxID=317549 RepID=A0A6S7GZI6_PARCT|nr:hypothetical protein BSL78_18317 [Paramuricea clavata]